MATNRRRFLTRGDATVHARREFMRRIGRATAGGLLVRGVPLGLGGMLLAPRRAKAAVKDVVSYDATTGVEPPSSDFTKSVTGGQTVIPTAGVGLVVSDMGDAASVFYAHPTQIDPGDVATFECRLRTPDPSASAYTNGAIGARLILDDGTAKMVLALGKDPTAGSPRVSVLGTNTNLGFQWNTDDPHLYSITRQADGNFRLRITHGVTGAVAADQVFSRGVLPVSSGPAQFVFGSAPEGAGACIFVRADGVVETVPKELTVRIDIKPGSDPNSISLSDQGLLPVAILGSATFDVTLIDPSTIELGGVDIALRGSPKRPKLAYSVEDANVDGFQDLVAFFDVPDLVAAGALTDSTIALNLTGQLSDGTPIQGADSVRVVP